MKKKIKIAVLSAYPSAALMDVMRTLKKRFPVCRVIIFPIPVQGKDAYLKIISTLKFVDELHWIEEKEMLDLVAIAQSSPGAIAINGAIVVGYKLAGITGVLVSIIGTIIPPFVIISLLSVFLSAIIHFALMNW